MGNEAVIGGSRARTIFILIVSCVMTLAAFCQGRATEERYGEYDVKAAFIYNFAKFVEWPEKATGAHGNVFQLCVLGEDPFGGALNQYQGKPVKEKKLNIRPLKSIRNASECRILFIAASERDRIVSILEAIGDTPVLTVGDVEGYARHGVVINLRLDSGKVRFNINQATARRSGLKISSQLLRLASSVYE
jgi:hypothetical protein